MLQRRLVRFYIWSEEDVNDEGTGQEKWVMVYPAMSLWQQLAFLTAQQ